MQTLSSRTPIVASQHPLSLLARVLDSLAIGISLFIAVNITGTAEEGWIRVQPGIVQDVLGAYVKSHALRFGPETATSNRANLGGMVGNNSAGARSLVYGKTVDHVIELKAILADGSRATFGPLRREELSRKT